MTTLKFVVLCMAIVTICSSIIAAVVSWFSRKSLKLKEKSNEAILDVGKKLQHANLDFKNALHAFRYYNGTVPNYELTFTDKRFVVDHFEQSLLRVVDTLTQIHVGDNTDHGNVITYLLEKTIESVPTKIIASLQYAAATKPSDYKSENFDVANWLDEGKLILCHELTIVCPTEDCDIACKKNLTAEIVKAINAAAVTKVYDRSTVGNRARHGTIVKYGQNEPTRFQWSEYNYNHMDEALLELSYAPINLTLEGKPYSVSMPAMMEETIATLKAGKNVVVAGSHGRGKTTLLENIESRFVDDKDVVVIRMEGPVVKSLATQEGTAMFENIIQNQSKDGRRVILTFDEAQQFSTKMAEDELAQFLQLLDGTMKRKANIAVLMFVNATLEQLRSVSNGAFMRPGRVSLSYEITDLPTSRILPLVKHIEKTNPQLALDSEGYKKLIGSASAPLSNVWSLFTEKDFDSERTKRLKGHMATFEDVS